MARINLLPWRQEARERKNREFITLVIGVLLLSLLAAGAAWSYFNNELDSQKQANEKIKQENTKLDGQLKEIDSLEKQRDEMLSRMKVIQDLQGRRPVPVRVWSDVAKAVPAQMYLINMKREGDVITFRGKADNANVVADFMRNLDTSPWLENAALKSITQPQATPYKTATPSTAIPNSPANVPTSAPRPTYPEDNYIDFVVTTNVKKSSGITDATSSTATTKTVTTTTVSATAVTVVPASSAVPTAVTPNSAPTAVKPAVAPAPANNAPVSNAPVSNTPISNTPISNTPVTNSTTITTTTTTKERNNG